MAIKANASSQGADFKNFIGVGSFRVLGVNPTKEQLSQFLGIEVSKDQEYLTDKVDANDDNKPYKQLKVTFMIQADAPSSLDKSKKETIKTNAALTRPIKQTVSFYIDSRYNFNRDKTKVQVIDIYGRTAWVTVEQAKNHQIPVYKNGPAKLDSNYKPAFRGEEALTKFILNYLNVTPIETYNKNTGEYMRNPVPEDCEGNLYEIKSYFKGDISELETLCKMAPDNYVKLCVGLQTTDEGKQYTTIYNGVALRNSAQSYTPFKDAINNDKNSSSMYDNVVFSDDPDGNITNLHVYEEKVTETDFSSNSSDPFSSPVNTSSQDELPFGPSTSDDPF